MNCWNLTKLWTFLKYSEILVTVSHHMNDILMKKVHLGNFRCFLNVTLEGCGSAYRYKKDNNNKKLLMTSPFIVFIITSMNIYKQAICFNKLLMSYVSLSLFLPYRRMVLAEFLWSIMVCTSCNTCPYNHSVPHILFLSGFPQNLLFISTSSTLWIYTPFQFSQSFWIHSFLLLILPKNSSNSFDTYTLSVWISS